MALLISHSLSDTFSIQLDTQNLFNQAFNSLFAQHLTVLNIYSFNLNISHLKSLNSFLSGLFNLHQLMKVLRQFHDVPWSLGIAVLEDNIHILQSSSSSFRIEYVYRWDNQKINSTKQSIGIHANVCK